jgi:hypothetical protein
MLISFPRSAGERLFGGSAASPSLPSASSDVCGHAAERRKRRSPAERGNEGGCGSRVRMNGTGRRRNHPGHPDRWR